MSGRGQTVLPVHHDGSAGLCDLDATTLAGLLRARTVSAVEVVTAYLARIEAINPLINALVTVDAAGAMAQAHALDAMADVGHFAGPLHGLPVAVKDIFATANMRTTYGSRLFANHVPSHDAVHVARLRTAGAVIIGKSNTAEFAYGAQTTNPLFGTTRNPHDLQKTVSGSSGGAAAALAAGLVALADGSDLGGSIRAPAGFVGIAGLRPTSRLVPLAGTPMPFDGLNVPGPMARRVADLQLMLSVMAGPSDADPLSQGLAPLVDRRGLAALSGLRFAWCMRPAGTAINARILRALAPARDLLEVAGGSIRDADPDLGDMVVAQQTFRDWSARLGPGTLGQRDKLGAEMQRTLTRADALCAEDLMRAEAIRARAWARVTAFFQDHDILVWPTNCQPPYGAEADTAKLGIDEAPILMTPALGLPALSIPFGVTEDGLPASLQFIGRRYSDRLLLDVGQRIEAAISGSRG
ncbi:amidase [Paracoccus sp. (in: a-proteobacteria)]|uniref:amidase n=1 Tax=Paracoccus sp. TaxID=267 RepID=UPI00322096C7